MIKTIKVKKQFRLDELLKYVWDNELNRIEAVSSSGRFKLKFIDNKSILVNSESTLGPFGSTVSLSTTEWEIEVEVKITEGTWFKNLIQIYETVPGNAMISIWDDSTTKEIINWNGNENTKKVYALIENKLQLIWEAE